MDRYNGILPVHKDPGMTSHDVIYVLRQIIAAQKVGHTGTLDPMASGLLLICLGRATKLTQFLTEWDKSYLAEITLGAVSDTLDCDGTITESGPVPSLNESEIQNVLAVFIGTVIQKVPAYSAVKVDGRELYKYARGGEMIDTPRRRVSINCLEMQSFDAHHISIVVRCSKGTYIRTLADDIGRKLGCGGYLSSLTRLSLGPFTCQQALTLTEVEARHLAGNLGESVIPIEQVLDFPVIQLRSRARNAIKHGGIPEANDIIGWSTDFQTGDLISMADEDGEIMAIGRSNYDASVLRSEKSVDFFSYVRVLI